MSRAEWDRFNRLTAEAASLPHGEVRVRLLEEAVRRADVKRDMEAMFDARMNLAESACFSGQVEKAFTAFAWCLAKFESDADRFRSQQFSVLWKFKNILHNASEFPQLALDQVEELLSQMASLYRRCGYNMRPVHYLRFVFATDIGDREVASESFARFRAEPRDGMADCRACEADSEIEYYNLMEEPERAVEAAMPNLLGRQSCVEVPHRTYSYVLRPLALLGRNEEADGYRRKGYRLIRQNPVFLSHVALQIVYLIHRGRVQPAVRMLERHLSWALKTAQLRARYLFYTAAKRALGHLAKRKPTHKLGFPPAFPAFQRSANYDLAELIGWFDAEQSALGNRFNARNGNDFFTKELAARLDY